MFLSLTLKIKRSYGKSAQAKIPPLQPVSESRITGCGLKTSEELDTSHSSLKPINLVRPPHWSTCLALGLSFLLLHFHSIPLPLLIP